MTPTATRLNLAPGTLYRCLLRLGGRAGYLYRVHGLALSYPSEQHIVVYEGIEGPDQGELFTCSVSDFALKFAELMKEPVPVEHVADLTSKGKY